LLVLPVAAELVPGAVLDAVPDAALDVEPDAVFGAALELRGDEGLEPAPPEGAAGVP
jgi:hypothetical protein